MTTLDILSDGPPPSRDAITAQLAHAADLTRALADGVTARADVTPAQRRALGAALARLHNAISETAAVFGHAPKGAR